MRTEAEFAWNLRERTNIALSSRGTLRIKRLATASTYELLHRFAAQLGLQEAHRMTMPLPRR
jgi:hypothetical protein